MSRSYRSLPQFKELKLVDEYSGWKGEGVSKREARKVIRKLQTKHNRHVLKQQLREEVQC